MIKLATMSSACPDWTLDEVVAGMKRHGYQGLSRESSGITPAALRLRLRPTSGGTFSDGWRTRG